MTQTETSIKALVKNSLYYMEFDTKNPLDYCRMFNGLYRDSLAYYFETEELVFD